MDRDIASQVETRWESGHILWNGRRVITGPLEIEMELEASSRHVLHERDESGHMCLNDQGGAWYRFSSRLELILYIMPYMYLSYTIYMRSCVWWWINLDLKRLLVYCSKKVIKTLFIIFYWYSYNIWSMIQIWDQREVGKEKCWWLNRAKSNTIEFAQQRQLQGLISYI